MTSREDIIWAAGLFEGEGCFSFSSGLVNRSLHAALNMTDEDVVRKFQRVIGLGTIVRRAPQKKGWKPQWCWYIGSFETVQAVVAMLWPWLCSRRKAKARQILALYHSREPTSFKIRQIRTAQIIEDLQRGAGGTRWRSGRTQIVIARKFGVSPARVTQIKQRVERERGALRPSRT